MFPLWLLGGKTVLSCRELAISGKISLRDFLAFETKKGEEIRFFLALKELIQKSLAFYGEIHISLSTYF